MHAKAYHHATIAKLDSLMVDCCYRHTPGIDVQRATALLLTLSSRANTRLM